MSEQITVTQFNERVNSVVSDSQMIRNISIVGEISSFNGSPAGHYYPTLKDKDSCLKCTFFKYSASRLKFKPEIGMRVIAFGSASYYVKGGTLSFNIESMQPYGKGDLQAALDELTTKLLKEGLFENERKKPLPRFPHTVGVVTSPTGAVIKDIIDTVKQRFPVNILLAPANVQGDDAIGSIVRGIESLNRQDVDVIIVGRGGGSAEDLSAFNSEAVVRAIAASRIPVISAVGHATDKSLSDRVADVYAETPTAAAVSATRSIPEETRNLDNLSMSVSRALRTSIENMRSRFSNLNLRLKSKNVGDAVQRYMLTLEQFSLRMNNVLKSEVTSYGNRLDMAESKLNLKRMLDRINENMIYMDELSCSMDDAIHRNITDMGNSFYAQCQILQSLDPTKVLGRGYSFIRSTDGRTLTSALQLIENTDIEIMMRDGSATASVKEVRNRND